MVFFRLISFLSSESSITKFMSSLSYFFPFISNMALSLVLPVITFLTSFPILSDKSVICFFMSPIIFLSLTVTEVSHIGHVAFVPNALVVLNTL